MNLPNYGPESIRMSNLKDTDNFKEPDTTKITDGFNDIGYAIPQDRFSFHKGIDTLNSGIDPSMLAMLDTIEQSLLQSYYMNAMPNDEESTAAKDQKSDIQEIQESKNLESNIRREDPPDSIVEDNKTESSEHEVINEWDDKYQDLLLNLVIKQRHNWKRIANNFFEQTGLRKDLNFLKKMYKKALAAKNTGRAKFNHNDDLQIVKYVNMYGLDWKKVASHFREKSPTKIKNRFYSQIKKKGKFDGLLEELNQLSNERNDQLENEITIQKKAKTIFLDENEDLPCNNTTYFEINVPAPEDQLSHQISSSGSLQDQ